MRFVPDMGISPSIGQWLRERGHDAVHVLDLGQSRAADSEIVQWAAANDRIVLTHDLDFGALMAASRAAVPSVVIFRLSNMKPGNVSSYLAIVLTRHEEALHTGAIVAVTDKRVRVRRLPI